MHLELSIRVQNDLWGTDNTSSGLWTSYGVGPTQNVFRSGEADVMACGIADGRLSLFSATAPDEAGVLRRAFIRSKVHVGPDSYLSTRRQVELGQNVFHVPLHCPI